MTRFLFAPAHPGTVRLFRALLACFCVFVFWPRPNTPVHPAHWTVAVGVLALFGAGWRPRLTGVLALGLLLPLAFLDRGQASRHVVLWTLLATSLWSGPGPIWPLRLLQIQLSVVYGANALAKSTWHYLSGAALAGLSVRLRWVAAGAGVAFHLLLMTIVRIFMLDLATMFLYLAFLLPFGRPQRS